MILERAEVTTHPAYPPPSRPAWSSLPEESGDHGEGLRRRPALIDSDLDISENEVPRGDCSTVIATGAPLEVRCPGCGKTFYTLNGCC